jgi:hypothetical protein
MPMRSEAAVIIFEAQQPTHNLLTVNLYANHANKLDTITEGDSESSA